MSEALKALERIKNAPTIYVGCASDIYTRYSFECKEIEQELKALEIIKEIGMLSVLKDFKGVYYLVVNNYAVEISKEKYDILKEVLTDER